MDCKRSRCRVEMHVCVVAWGGVCMSCSVSALEDAVLVTNLGGQLVWRMCLDSACVLVSHQPFTEDKTHFVGR